MLHLGFVLDSTASILLVNKGQQNPGRRQLLYLKLSIDWQINANSHFALCLPILHFSFSLLSSCDYSFTCSCFNLLISLKDISPFALQWPVCVLVRERERESGSVDFCLLICS